MHTVIIQIRLMGKPISLSAGVPVLNPDARYDLALHAFSACWGEASLPLQGLAIGPDQPEWAAAFSRPAGAGDERACEKLQVADPARSIPFSGLSSPCLYWVEAKKDYTHILMDVRNRRMVGVKPFQPEVLTLRPNPWALIKRALEEPDFTRQHDALETDTAPQLTEERLEVCSAAGFNRVYACLHPAPVGASGTALWVFDGLPWVRVEHPAVGDWEQAFENACDSSLPDPHFVG
jgi:hypothetical protein